MSSETKTRRCAIWSAIGELSRRGYLTGRCCGKDRIFDIIAWNRDHVLGLIIRTARTSDIRTCHDEVRRLRSVWIKKSGTRFGFIMVEDPGTISFQAERSSSGRGGHDQQVHA